MVMEVWGLTGGNAGGKEGKLRGTVGCVAKPAGPGQARRGQTREQTKTNSAHLAHFPISQQRYCSPPATNRCRGEPVLTTDHCIAKHSRVSLIKM